MQPEWACGYPVSLALLISSLSVSLQQQKPFFFFLLGSTVLRSVHQTEASLLFSPKQVAHTGLIRDCYLWKPPAAAAAAAAPLRSLKANRNGIKLRLIKAKRGAERGSAGPSRAALWGRDEWPLFSPQPQHLSEGNPDGCMCNDSICLTVYRIGEPLYRSPLVSIILVNLLVTLGW